MYSPLIPISDALHAFPLPYFDCFSAHHPRVVPLFNTHYLPLLLSGRLLRNVPSFFKTLIDQQVTVELKNDIKITGTLKSVDQYLNIKLEDISVQDDLKYPHLSAVKNVFIRGSVVRYVHLPSNAVDVTLLEDAARRGTSCCVTYKITSQIRAAECVVGLTVYLDQRHQIKPQRQSEEDFGQGLGRHFTLSSGLDVYKKKATLQLWV